MNEEVLTKGGIDYREGLDRFGGSADLYEKFLNMFFESKDLEDARAAFDAGDLETAFNITHSMKGTPGNLSVNTFYRTICAVNESLRSRKPDPTTEPLLKKAESEYEAAKKAFLSAR